MTQVAAIPTLSEKQLNLFDLNFLTTPWKKEFYSRHIQSVVPMMIAQDFDEVEGMELVTALQTFVNNGTGALQNKDLALTNMLKSFDIIANQSLPGGVTRRFSNPSVKKTIEKAYQDLILLEVVYNIEKIVLEKNNKPSAELEQWLKAKKTELTPSRLSKYRHAARKIKNIIVGDFFENAFVWSTRTVPYFTKVFLQNLWNGARRLEHEGKRIENLGIISFQSLLIPIALMSSVILQLNSLVKKFIDLPLTALEKIFKNSSRLNSALLAFRFIFNQAFQLYAIYTLWPIIVPVVSASFLLGGAVPLFLYAMSKLNPFKNNFLQNESPFMGYPNLTGLGLSTLFPWITPNKVNVVIERANLLYTAKYKTLTFSKETKAHLLALTPDEKTAVLENLMTFFKQEGRKFFEDNFITIQDHVFNTIEDALKKFLASYLELKLADPAVPAAADIAPEEQYNREALAARIFKLQNEMDKTKEQYDAVTVEAIKNAPNPHVYLSQFTRRSELPAPLQVLLPAPELPSACPEMP